MGQFWPGCCCTTECRVLKIRTRGCGPAGATGNPTVHPVTGTVVEVRDASNVLVGTATSAMEMDGATMQAIVRISVPAAGTYTISGVSPEGTLTGTMSSGSITCTTPASEVNLILNMTADNINYNCLDGVLYRPLETTLILTDSQATRTLLHGVNLRGQSSSDRWEVCAIVASDKVSSGNCDNHISGNVRVVYEFNSVADAVTNTWVPRLAQVWHAVICGQPNKSPQTGGQSCPPPNPSGLSDFNQAYGLVADSWSAGPPFTATFTFPSSSFTQGSTTTERWTPIPGTITVSEAP